MDDALRSLLLGLLALLTVLSLLQMTRARRWIGGWLQVRSRRVVEDALKHVLSRQHQGRLASPESLSGALGISGHKTLSLIMGMEAQGLVTSQGGGLALTEAGERRALRVVRAHRLLETYLADEAGMPLTRVHGAAERAEHDLSEEDVDALDVRLGHPRSDPHGDPIPSATGEMAPLDAVPLTDWPLGETAQIAHVEDEPASVYRKIPGALLRPGGLLRILRSDAKELRVASGADELTVAPAVAANIQVIQPGVVPAGREGCVPLSGLSPGERGEVVWIEPAIRGFSRRRMLDLGLTAGARVEAYLKNPFGDPVAFRVRGATVALRKEQAARIWVKPTAVEGRTKERVAV